MLCSTTLEQFITLFTKSCRPIQTNGMADLLCFDFISMTLVSLDHNPLVLIYYEDKDEDFNLPILKTYRIYNKMSHKDTFQQTYMYTMGSECRKYFRVPRRQGLRNSSASQLIIIHFHNMLGFHDTVNQLILTAIKFGGLTTF